LSIFLLGLAPRLINLQQPLVENYIDRQVHTAMMARNLARGGSPLYPEIDIGPFPAYYMLECPIYPALAAGVSAITGLELDVAGRLVSAVAMAIACLLLYDLVRRHESRAVAALAAAAMALMPVTIRYGRAFQPDSMMIAFLVAGIWAMDRWCERGRRDWLIVAAAATSGALLLKVISAYVLLPLAYLAWKRCGWSTMRRWELWAALAIAVLPSAAWYVHAWQVASGAATVSTPFWQAHKWVSLERLLDLATYRQLAYFIGLRVLTPIGVCLAVGGVLLRVRGQLGVHEEIPFEVPVPLLCSGESEKRNRYSSPESTSRNPQPDDTGFLFHVWLFSLAAYFPILVRKLDHEHYYLALAPVAAVFIARALVALAAAPLAGLCYVGGRTVAVGLGVGLVACNALASRSTFRVPGEWRSVIAAATSARELIPPDAKVAAHSSVLFYADRRGFTMAYGPDEIEYLFGTWGQRTNEPNPTALIEFYRRYGAEYFVELLGTGREQDNSGFLDYLRTHYRVVREEPGQYLVVDLKG
jgi:4-amino-4-deoxy-L-arabinose transferase-like glycosyltransferase